MANDAINACKQAVAMSAFQGWGLTEAMCYAKAEDVKEFANDKDRCATEMASGTGGDAGVADCYAKPANKDDFSDLLKRPSNLITGSVSLGYASGSTPPTEEGGAKGEDKPNSGLVGGAEFELARPLYGSPDKTVSIGANLALGASQEAVPGTESKDGTLIGQASDFTLEPGFNLAQASGSIKYSLTPVTFKADVLLIGKPKIPFAKVNGNAPGVGTALGINGEVSASLGIVELGFTGSLRSYFLDTQFSIDDKVRGVVGSLALGAKVTPAEWISISLAGEVAGTPNVPNDFAKLKLSRSAEDSYSGVLGVELRPNPVKLTAEYLLGTGASLSGRELAKDAMRVSAAYWMFKASFTHEVNRLLATERSAAEKPDGVAGTSLAGGDGPGSGGPTTIWMNNSKNTLGFTVEPEGWPITFEAQHVWSDQEVGETAGNDKRLTQLMVKAGF